MQENESTAGDSAGPPPIISSPIPGTSTRASTPGDAPISMAALQQFMAPFSTALAALKTQVENAAVSYIFFLYRIYLFSILF